jgi:AraC-like DNA-binding protein
MKEIPKIRFKESKGHSIAFEIMPFSGIFQQPHPDHEPDQPHRLNFYAIIFIMAGNKGIHYIDFKEHHYKKGSLIFISKEQVHAFKSLKNNDGYLILFTENFLAKYMVSADWVFLQQLFNYQLYHPVVATAEKQFLEFKALSEKIYHEQMHAPDFAKERILHSYLNIFLLKSERLRKDTSTYMEAAYHQEFLKFQHLLQKDLFKSRSVKYYADQLNMSSKKLNMITQETVNLPAKTYIISSLVLEIKRMLLNSTLTINEVGYKTGFDEPTNFVKFVKKYTQMTPAELRKTLR